MLLECGLCQIMSKLLQFIILVCERQRMITFNRNIKKAITLAELLMALMIIGVLYMLAIPVIEKVELDRNKEAARVAFSIFSQATIKVLQDKGGNLKGVFSSSQDILNAYLPYLNVQKSCNLAEVSGNCFHAKREFRYLNNEPYPYQALNNSSSGMILSNGFLVNIYTNNASTCFTDSFPDHCADITVDINGWSRPNRIGYDIFVYVIYPDRLVPMPKSISSCIYPPDAGWDGATNHGWGCTEDIIMGR